MCGICGKLNFDRERPVPQSQLKQMADAIYHRGPDDEGYYTSGPVGFGFRRLSIIDLNTGHQPISNEDGTIWIVFNGEIYNFQELRDDLQKKGHVFRTKTDTEAIVHLYEEYGERCVEKLRGMFGFAIWDSARRRLFVARDRVGIKPIYYALTKDSFVFGSEMKAVLASGDVPQEVDPQMVDRFLTYHYLPGEETSLKSVRKLPPGCYMVVENGQAKITQYWDLSFAPREQSFEEAQRELMRLFEQSIALHMISDVPVGFLLSGGVDSTAMLGLAVGKSPFPLSSFTLGFNMPGLADERPYARLAAEGYGVQHHDMTISAQEFADFLPQFAWHMEEPVCEPQAVALYYVSRLAKDFVKVLISGEGGDEAFAGYQTYRGVLWLERLKRLSGPFRRPLGSMMEMVNRAGNSHRLDKYAPLMNVPFEEYFHGRTTTPFSYFHDDAEKLYSSDFYAHVDREHSLAPTKAFHKKRIGGGLVNRMLYLDTKSTLPDDLLLKADKMTMANSVELRVPLLDHNILEFAATLPESFKVKGFTTKYIAKKALSQRVPREILERKKAGFPVPYQSWFRSELRNWVADVLLDRKSIGRGYFNGGEVERLVQANAATGAYSRELLSLIALEFWHRAFADKTDMGTAAARTSANSPSSLTPAGRMS